VGGAKCRCGRGVGGTALEQHAAPPDSFSRMLAKCPPAPSHVLQIGETETQATVPRGSRDLSE
jgi:hypothetical protein